jgi:sarcosine oxidase gamma subunit
MLEATDMFEGLPLCVGAARLEALALPEVALVAPFKGRMMAVADVLKAEIGLILPPSGHCGERNTARAYWRAPGQWLVFGALDAGKLAGMAAVADMSDALGGLRLTGGGAVLARLVEIDVERMQAGHVAHTVLADIPITLIAQADGFELLVPRSYAGSAVARIITAMQSVAARGLVG